MRRKRQKVGDEAAVDVMVVAMHIGGDGRYEGHLAGTGQE